MTRCPRLPRVAAALTAATAIVGCAGSRAPLSASRFENFDSQETHARLVDATPAQACEAARRALLSQGYLIGSAGAEFVSGRKSFQPTREAQVDLEMRVVCVRESPGGEIATVFVSGIEERYALKKSSSSASVGVGALGSLSLPFAAGDEALVRVGTQTITQPAFYDRFYALVYRFLGAPSPDVDDDAPATPR